MEVDVLPGVQFDIEAGVGTLHCLVVQSTSSLSFSSSLEPGGGSLLPEIPRGPVSPLSIVWDNA